jgi:hypothetical protein
LAGLCAHTFGNHNVTGPLGCAGLIITIAAMVMLWRLASDFTLAVDILPYRSARSLSGTWLLIQ